MKTILQFAAFALAFFAATTSFAQGAGKVSYSDLSVVIQLEKESEWRIADLPAQLADGRHTLATRIADGLKVVAVIRSGKIAAIAVDPVGGTFKVLSPNSGAPCFSGPACYSFQVKHCYTLPGGGCVCVCGAFVAATN
jgi:hypothetical protein